jgi:hypothetical protein
MASQMGSEAFWPVTGDFPQQMDKAARILRAFTGAFVGLASKVSACWLGADAELVSRSAVDGVETTVPVDTSKDPRNGALGM